MSVSPTNRFGRSLQDILALEHPDPQRRRAKFMSELRELVLAAPGRRADDWPTLPPIARLVVVLDIALSQVSASGLAGLLEADEYIAALPAAADACVRIGAKQSASYLRQGHALMVHAGAADEDARRALVQDSESAANDSLAALDGLHQQHIGAEVADRLRTWVASHERELVAELAAPTGTAPPRSRRVPATGQRVRTERSVAGSPAPSGVPELRFDSDGNELHCWRFVREAAALPESAWAEVARRFTASRRRIDRAVDEVIAAGEAPVSPDHPWAEKDRRRAAVARLREFSETVVHARIAALPDSAATTQGEVELRQGAKLAYWSAGRVLARVLEVANAPAALRQSDVALAPFDGFVTAFWSPLQPDARGDVRDR